MSKDKISDYSATANSNTDIGGINIDEGCAPSGINDAIRTLMKQLKDWQSGSQDVYIHPAGSASVPSITATGDTNTGIFFPAADTVGIATGGTERARVDSSGNLGLGVTPSAWASFPAIQFVGGYSVSPGGFGQNTYYNAGFKNITTGGSTLYQPTGGAHIWYSGASGSAGSAITFTQAMTLDASGNLGVGTTSPSSFLSTQRSLVIGAGSGDIGQTIYTGSSSQGTIAFADGLTGDQQYRGYIAYIHSSDALTFGSAGAERARLRSEGCFSIGTTSSGYDGTNTGIWLRGNIATLQASRDSNPSCNFARIGTDGSVVTFDKGASTVGNISVTTTATAYNTSSDYRLKHEIAPMTGALAKVAALKPVTYKWNADNSDGEGFIAHELAEVCPHAVVGEKDAVETYTDDEGNEQTRPLYQGIDTSFLVATLTAAIQEQQAIITQLQADVAALKGQA